MGPNGALDLRLASEPNCVMGSRFCGGLLDGYVVVFGVFWGASPLLRLDASGGLFFGGRQQ